MKNSFLIQSVRYGTVGIINTLLTAVVIWAMMHFVFRPESGKFSVTAISISNAVGYIVGVINSYICNRLWTFKSKNNWKPEAVRFVVVFLFCYAVQLALVHVLYKHAVDSTAAVAIQLALVNAPLWHAIDSTAAVAEICQLIGIIAYTVLNFIMNKYITFRAFRPKGKAV